MKSNATVGKYDLDGGLALKGQADMIKDEVVLLFRSIGQVSRKIHWL